MALSRRILLALLSVTALGCPQDEKKKASEETDEDDSDKKKKKKKKKKKDKDKDDDDTEETATATATATAKPPPTATATATAKADANKVPDLAVGQWVRYDVSYGPERASQEFRITKIDADGTVTMEIEGKQVGSESVTEAVIEMKDRSTPDGIVVKQARVKTQTGIVSLPPSGIAVSMKDEVRMLLSPPFGTGKKEDVKTPAGSFDGCTVVERETSEGGGKVKRTSYWHATVPITGLVKEVEFIKPSTTTYTAAAFGMTGGKKAF